MTLEVLQNRRILGAGNTWKPPVWPLDPSEPRPPAVLTTLVVPPTSSTPPPPRPTTTHTHPSEAGPSRSVFTASRPLRPRSTPPPPHTFDDAPPSSLEAKVDYIFAYVQRIGAHFGIPPPPFPIIPPAPPSPIQVPSPIPSPILSPLPSSLPQSSPIRVPVRKGKEKVPEHSAFTEDEVDATIGQTLDWLHDPDWITRTCLTPGAQQARIDAGETSDGKGTQSAESGEEEEDAAADQFIVLPHEDIGLCIDDIDRSAAIEGDDVELDEIAEDIRQVVEAEDDDEETVSEHAQDDASSVSGSTAPAASS